MFSDGDPQEKEEKLSSPNYTGDIWPADLITNTALSRVETDVLHPAANWWNLPLHGALQRCLVSQVSSQVLSMRRV